MTRDFAIVTRLVREFVRDIRDVVSSVMSMGMGSFRLDFLDCKNIENLERGS